MPSGHLRHPHFTVHKHEAGNTYKQLGRHSALVLGDAHEVLAAFPDGCAQTVVTSPILVPA